MKVQPYNQTNTHTTAHWYSHCEQRALLTFLHDHCRFLCKAHKRASFVHHHSNQSYSSEQTICRHQHQPQNHNCAQLFPIMVGRVKGFSSLRTFIAMMVVRNYLNDHLKLKYWRRLNRIVIGVVSSVAVRVLLETSFVHKSQEGIFRSNWKFIYWDFHSASIFTLPGCFKFKTAK